MGFSLTCPYCGNSNWVFETELGRILRCARCTEPLQVPSKSPPPGTLEKPVGPPPVSRPKAAPASPSRLRVVLVVLLAGAAAFLLWWLSGL